MANKDREMRIDITAKDKTKKGVASARKGLNSLAAGVGVVGTAVGGLGLGLLVKQSLEVNDALAKNADKLGINIKALSGYHLAIGIAGGSTEGMNKAIQMMNRNVADAANGIGIAKDSLKEMGLEADQLRQAGPEQAMLAIVEGLNNVENAADRTNFAMNIFGRSGTDILNLTTEALQDAVIEADQLGLALDRADAAKIEAANDSMLRMTSALSGAITTLTVELAPFITVFGDMISNATKDSEGFEDQILSVFETTLTGIGFVGDAWRGWELIIAGLEVGLRGFGALYWGVIGDMDTGIGRMINNSINLLNSLIEKANAIPGVSLPLLSNVAASSSGIQGIVANANDLLDESIAKLTGLADQKLPSENIEEWIARVRAAADVAAKEIEEKVEAKLAAGVDTGESLRAREEAQKAQTAIDEKEAQKRIDIAEREWQQKVGLTKNFTATISNINQLLSSQGEAQSKREFERNKRVGVSTTLVNTAIAAVDAAKSTPGGVYAKLGAIAAVVSGGLAQVSAINSQSYGGGGTTAAGGGGTATGTFTSPLIVQDQEDVLQPSPESQPQPERIIHVTVLGNVVDQDEHARGLVSAIRKAERDDVEDDINL